MVTSVESYVAMPSVAMKQALRQGRAEAGELLEVLDQEAGRLTAPWPNGDDVTPLERQYAIAAERADLATYISWIDEALAVLDVQANPAGSLPAQHASGGFSAA